MSLHGQPKGIASELTAENVMIATLRANGAKQSDIANAVGLTQNAVSCRLRNQTLQDFIRGYHERLINKTLPKAIENVEQLVDRYNDETDSQRKDHGFKATTEILKSTGIFVGSSPSALVVNNVQTVLNPSVETLLFGTETSEED